jgi:uroporphyrinogen-III synthase
MTNFSKEKTYAIFDTPINKKTIAQLSTENIETIIFPTISPKPLENSGINSLLQNLNQFDWLVFTDVYTVEYFLNLLKKFGIDLFELDEFRVLAFGEAVADRLRFSQIHADVIPSTIKTSDILQALKDYVFDEGEFENLRFLIVKEQNCKVELKKILLEMNSMVTEMLIYNFEMGEETVLPRLKALLKGGAIDEFIFSSHFDVLNLAQLFQTENLTQLLFGIELTATDNLTLQSLQEFRLIEK